MANHYCTGRSNLRALCAWRANTTKLRRVYARFSRNTRTPALRHARKAPNPCRREPCSRPRDSVLGPRAVCNPSPPYIPRTASAFAEVREPCDRLASPRARRAQRRPMQGAGGPSSGPGPGEIAVSEYPCLACALQGPFATAPLSQRPQLCRGSVLVMHRCQKSDRKRGPRRVPTAACPRAHLARFARYLLARCSTFVPGNVKGW